MGCRPRQNTARGATPAQPAGSSTGGATWAAADIWAGRSRVSWTQAERSKGVPGRGWSREKNLSAANRKHKTARVTARVL